MPRGRKPDLNKRIHALILELKAALVARARQRIEAQVDARVATLVDGLQRVVEGNSTPSARGASPGAAKPSARKGGRKPRSAASRAAQAKKMRAYWKKKKAGKADAK
jgi:hypothetical protein